MLADCTPEEMISIHALREEGDPKTKNAAERISKFQSTPSARRATPRWQPGGA